MQSYANVEKNISYNNNPNSGAIIPTLYEFVYHFHICITSSGLKRGFSPLPT